MKHVEKSALVWFSPAQMFALVTDVASYPQFLPWCDQARVLEQDEHGMLAEVGMAFARVRQSFVTRNEHVGQERVRMQLVRGPFSTLQGEWTFQPIGGQSAEQSQACHILWVGGTKPISAAGIAYVRIKRAITTMQPTACKAMAAAMAPASVSSGHSTMRATDKRPPNTATVTRKSPRAAQPTGAVLMVEVSWGCCDMVTILPMRTEKPTDHSRWAFNSCCL